LRTYASSSLSAPECGVKPHRTFLELTGLALRLTFRRWQLYSTAILTAFAVQIALALVWRVPHAIELGSSIAIPLVTALVYAFVSADAGEAPAAESLVWERFLERAWAVIVIDFLLTDIATAALVYSMSAKPLELVGGLAAFAFAVLTVFADAGAVVDDDVTVWTVIPRALLRSITTTWNSTIFARALAIFSLQLLAFVAQNALYFGLMHFDVSQALFWAEIPMATLITPPLAAITVVVYRDAAGVLG
jgi:hypothetical protein